MAWLESRSYTKTACSRCFFQNSPGTDWSGSQEGLNADHRLCDPALVGMVHVGTSAWANPTLIRDSDFYPPTVRTPADRLRYYASQFPLVEADSTYYRVPSEQM